jgi:hypothetical protein
LATVVSPAKVNFKRILVVKVAAVNSKRYLMFKARLFFKILTNFFLFCNDFVIELVTSAANVEKKN